MSRIYGDGSPQLPSEPIHGSWAAIERQSQEEATTMHGMVQASLLVLMSVYQLADEANDEPVTLMMEPTLEGLEKLTEYLQRRIK